VGDFVRTCVIIPAAHHILYRLLCIERLLVFHYAKRGEAPVDRVHPQVGRHVVGQVIVMLCACKRHPPRQCVQWRAILATSKTHYDLLFLDSGYIARGDR
jgi:hypothetical protein